MTGVRKGRGRDRSPLLFAVIRDKLEAAKFLLEQGAISDGYIGLAVSVEMMDLLLLYGDNINGGARYDYAAHFYVTKGRKDLLSRAISAGLDTTNRGIQRGLFRDCREHHDMIPFLVELGFDINVMESNFPVLMFHLCAEYEFFRQLMLNGARFRAVERGGTLDEYVKGYETANRNLKRLREEFGY